MSLLNLGVDGLLVAGVSTSSCVETTARDAADRGFKVVIVEDATAEIDEPSHDATLRQFAVRWGRVVDAPTRRSPRSPRCSSGAMADPSGLAGRAQRPVRSALFVPANRRAWIEKVHGYGADAVVLDLEDATPPGHKAQARAIVRDVLPLLQSQDQGVWIRVNALGSEHLDEDLETACRDGVDLICLPKVSGPGDIAELDRLIGYHEGRNGLPRGTLGI